MLRYTSILFLFLIANSGIIFSQALIDFSSFNPSSYCYELKLDKAQKQFDKLEGQKTKYYVVMENHGTDSLKIYWFTFINNELFSFNIHFKVPQGIVMNYNEIVADGKPSLFDSTTFDIAIRVKISGDNRISFFVPATSITHVPDSKQQLSSYFNCSISTIKLVESESGISKDSIMHLISTSFYQQVENVTNSLKGDIMKSNPNSGANYSLIKYYQIYHPFEDDILKYAEGLSFALEIELMSMSTDSILNLVHDWEMSTKLPYVFTAYKVLYFRTSISRYLLKYQEYLALHEKLIQEDPLNYKAVLLGE